MGVYGAGRDCRVTIRIPKKLKAKLFELAKADKRSMADYLTVLLEAHIELKQLIEAKK